MSDGYEDYCKGLRFLEGNTYPETEEDWTLCKSVLSSLHGSIIGAGSNTWYKHTKRYERARARYELLKKEAGRV